MTGTASDVRTGLGRPFTQLWASTGAANLADGLLLAGLPVLATTVTTSGGQVAAVLTVFMTAMGLASLPAGVVADRGSGRRVLVSTNVVRLAVLSGLIGAALAADVRLVLLYVAAAMCGSTEVVNDVTAETLVPSLVGPRRMAAAHGRLTATQTVLNDAVGAPLGALLGATGIVWALGAPAALYGLGALVAAGLVVPPRSATVATAGGAGDAAGRMVADVREGLAQLWSDRVLRRLAVASSALNLANTAFFAVLVLLVIGPMGLPRSSYGLLLAAVAIGGSIGGAVAERAVRGLGQRWVLLLGPVTIGGAYGLTCRFPHPGVAIPSLVLMAAVGMVWNVTARVLRQQRVPHALLGRVSTSMRLVSLAATPIGGVAAALVAETAGVRAVGVVTTLAAVAALLCVARVPIEPPTGGDEPGSGPPTHRSATSAPVPS